MDDIRQTSAVWHSGLAITEGPIAKWVSEKFNYPTVKCSGIHNRFVSLNSLSWPFKSGCAHLRWEQVLCSLHCNAWAAHQHLHTLQLLPSSPHSSFGKRKVNTHFLYFISYWCLAPIFYTWRNVDGQIPNRNGSRMRACWHSICSSTRDTQAEATSVSRCFFGRLISGKSPHIQRVSEEWFGLHLSYYIK